MELVDPKVVADMLLCFFLKQFFYIFTLISSFKVLFVEGNLGVQKWSNVIVLDFQIEF